MPYFYGLSEQLLYLEQQSYKIAWWISETIAEEVIAYD